METYRVLLRGINVGGNNIPPMKANEITSGTPDLQHVQSYIQGGDCVFDGDKTAHLQVQL